MNIENLDSLAQRLLALQAQVAAIGEQHRTTAPDASRSLSKIADELATAIDHIYAMTQERQPQTTPLDVSRESLDAQHSQEDYRIISEITSDYVYRARVDPDGVVFLEWISDAFMQNLGIDLKLPATSAELVALTHPDDQAIIKQHLKRLLAGYTDEQTIRFIDSRGQIHWLRNTARPQWLPVERRVVSILGASRDITEYKRASEDLQKTQALLASVFDASPIGIAITDVDHRLINVNRAFCEMLGYAEHELLQKRVIDLLSPEEGHKELARIAKARAQGDITDRFEKQYTKKDGSIVWASVSATILPASAIQQPFSFAMIEDITAQKQIESALHSARYELEQRVRQRTIDLERANAALRESQNFIRQITDTVAAIVYVYDLDAHRNVYANRAVRIMMKYEAEEFQRIEKNFLHELIHPDDRPILERQYQQCADAADDEFIEAEYRIRAANGDWRWLYNRNVVFTRDDNGRPRQIIGAAVDITARKYAENLLKQTREELERRVVERTFDLVNANQMLRHEIEDRIRAEEQLQASLREKDVLLKEIHHRVKNNLQIISSLLDLQAEQSPDTKNVEAFRESQNRIRSMAVIHEKLYQSADLTLIDFSQYVYDLTDYLQQSYTSNAYAATFSIEIDNVFLPIDAAIPCGLIINELVSNALKYAFPSGRQGAIRIAFNKVDDHLLRLIVSDNGVGLPQGFDLQQISKLGLQLFQMLVRQLKGTFVLEKHAGTTFAITFAEPKPKER